LSFSTRTISALIRLKIRGPIHPKRLVAAVTITRRFAHGWHFNAASPTATDSGRPGQPLFWSDARTGTHLPLSYRDWQGVFNPSDLGLTNWQIAAKLGGYLPGMSPDTVWKTKDGDQGQAGAPQDSAFSIDRSHITGPLTVDCMLCHHRPGSGYSPFVWTEQVAEQNFAYAPTAALGLAVVTGGMRRLKDDFDPSAEGAAQLLPKVDYQADRFRSDGKVFVDLIRRPSNDSCYYCHTEMSSDAPLGNRWLHDEDVHLRGGMQCVDCHRNGLDHQTVRGYENEAHPSLATASVLSCKGCHLGEESSDPVLGAGRLGAPKPAHHGIPPIHFEKMSCTSCHSGTAVSSEVSRQITSLAHRLGEHVKRKGDELPAIFGSVMLPVDAESHVRLKQDGEGVYTPHRMMWPSYWGVLKEGRIEALNPEQVYDLIRKPLRVRRDFMEELGEVKLSLTQRKEILQDDRAARMKPEELSEEQRRLIEAAEEEMRKTQVAERVASSLAEIETEFPDGQAVLVSGGTGFVRDADGKLKELDDEQLSGAAEAYAWPVAHAVRPARQSLGIEGCQECHSDQSPFFFASIQPVGVLPGQEVLSVAVNEMQHVDTSRLTVWNQLFSGRSSFKVFGLIALALTAFLGLTAWVANLSGVVRRQSPSS
jgi:hypothetical protein